MGYAHLMQIRAQPGRAAKEKSSFTVGLGRTHPGKNLRSPRIPTHLRSPRPETPSLASSPTPSLARQLPTAPSLLRSSPSPISPATLISSSPARLPAPSHLQTPPSTLQTPAALQALPEATRIPIASWRSRGPWSVQAERRLLPLPRTRGFLHRRRPAPTSPQHVRPLLQTLVHPHRPHRQQPASEVSPHFMA
jgi:hypothetical protein